MIEKNAAENEFLHFYWILTRKQYWKHGEITKIISDIIRPNKLQIKICNEVNKKIQYRFKEHQRLK